MARRIPSQGMGYPSFKPVACPLHPSAIVVRVKGNDICEECLPMIKALPNRAARRAAFRRSR